MSTISEAELKQITDQPTITELLPYVFENGSRIDSMAISCATCGENVPREHAHGEISTYGETVTLKAHLLCYDCRIISPFECRIRNDGTLLIKGDSTWTEERYAPEPGIVESAKKLIEKARQALGV